LEVNRVSDEIKVSNSQAASDYTPVFSRPVDHLRKSKVEARQARRNMFRDKLEGQKSVSKMSNSML